MHVKNKLTVIKKALIYINYCDTGSGKSTVVSLL